MFNPQVDRDLHHYFVRRIFSDPDFDWMEIIAESPVPPDARGRHYRANPLLLGITLNKAGFVEAIADQLEATQGPKRKYVCCLACTLAIFSV